MRIRVTTRRYEEDLIGRRAQRLGLATFWRSASPSRRSGALAPSLVLNRALKWSIRSVEPNDRDAIVRLVGEAFASPSLDDHEEVAIVEITWERNASIDGLELVAVDGKAVVGYVLGARADLGGRAVVGVAPLAVAVSHQRRGIGSALMNELIRRADDQGWALIALLGDPDFYGRFGFVGSSTCDIRYDPIGKGDPHFQVRRLHMFDASYRGALRYCWEIPDTH